MPSDTKEAIKKLKAVQQKLWAILGLKMATDRLKALGYDVVAHSGTDGSTTIKVELKVNFDFGTGFVNGKDIVASQEELQRRIDEFKGSLPAEKKEEHVIA